MYQLTCDGCSNRTEPCPTKQSALAVAHAEHGWTTHFNRHYCRNCTAGVEDGLRVGSTVSKPMLSVKTGEKVIIQGAVVAVTAEHIRVEWEVSEHYPGLTLWEPRGNYAQ